MLGFDLGLAVKYRRFQSDFFDIGKIGHGGFAQVHRVRSRLDFREYALKIIEIKPNQCKQDVIDTIHKFLDEVKILSYLNHKNIIEYHGCWVECEVGDEIMEVKNHESEEEQVTDANQEIVMVMQDQMSSSGIQFGCDSDENAVSPKSIQNSKNSSTYLRPEKQVLDIPIDHSQASANIRSGYKTIKIFILSELCESNLQSYLYRRNLTKKSLLQQSKQSSPSKSKLASKTRLQQKLSKQDILQNYMMILQIIEGLEYLHSKKIIHRDIKLHNIVMDRQKKCKIIDYGLAKKTRMLQSISEYPKDLKDLASNPTTSRKSSEQESELSDEIFSSSVGTRIYSSPEQISSERYDHRTDIFSLAIVILMFFCDFTTNHEELIIIEKIRKNDLNFINCDQRLKNIMSKCLGQQKFRPRLVEIKSVVRTLLRQEYQKESKKLQENSLPENHNALQKEQNIYIVENSKLKKKMSREEYFMLNPKSFEKQSSTSSNSISSVNEEDTEVRNIVRVINEKL